MGIVRMCLYHTGGCTVLYCNVQYSTVHSTFAIQGDVTSYLNPRRSPEVHAEPQPISGCSAVLYSTVLYCTVLYCTVLYCIVLYCTVHCTPSLGWGQAELAKG